MLVAETRVILAFLLQAREWSARRSCTWWSVTLFSDQGHIILQSCPA